MEDKSKVVLLRFGAFELDLEAEQLLKNGRLIRIQPQPFKLLCLLTSQTGKLVTREEIQAALWTNDTFVDFEQGVNFAIKQVREALSDQAENPIYIQTLPKRGYKFVAPVSAVTGRPGVEEPRPAAGDPQLERALWENIAELRLAEERRKKQRKGLMVALVSVALVLAALFLVRSCGTSPLPGILSRAL